MYVRGIYATVSMWRSEDNFQESVVLSLGSNSGRQVPWHLNQLTYLASPLISVVGREIAVTQWDLLQASFLRSA